MPIEIRDPATGKLKPSMLIAAAGVAVIGIIFWMGRGASSTSNTAGTTSTGQSSDITAALQGLNEAITGLANAGGVTSGSGTSGSPASVTTPHTRPMIPPLTIKPIFLGPPLKYPLFPRATIPTQQSIAVSPSAATPVTTTTTSTAPANSLIKISR